MNKSILKSKTFWSNVFFAVLIPLFPAVKSYLTPEVFTALIAIANVLLRLVTKEPVSVK